MCIALSPNSLVTCEQNAGKVWFAYFLPPIRDKRGHKLSPKFHSFGFFYELIRQIFPANLPCIRHWARLWKYGGECPDKVPAPVELPTSVAYRDYPFKSHTDRITTHCAMRASRKSTGTCKHMQKGDPNLRTPRERKTDFIS